MFLNSVSSIGIGGVLHLPFLAIATITLAFKVNFFYSKLDRKILIRWSYKGGSNNCKL
jgi:hypothetical protein